MKKKKHSSQLYFLMGTWLSFVALFIAGSVFMPVERDFASGSPALLYKFAQNEELRRAPETALADGEKLIIADLSGMTLSLYEGSTLVRSFPILSRGREGTFWETPTGKYTIQTKERKHFSSIGDTWMPYSMQFYGNFFIHGWPTYADGSDVPRGYSGGCIRLSTENAGEVYAFSAIGTRVFITGGLPKGSVATSSRYYLRSPDTKEEPPVITAPAFVVADIERGTVLWEREAGSLRDAGALVSLPTALASVEVIDQYKIVRMGELLLGKSVARKYSIGAADELPLGALIYPLLFDANDTAAKAFAGVHGTEQFVSYMNQKAKAIGMDDTQFSGVLSSDTSTTTARDLLTLLRYVEARKNFLITVSLLPEREWRSDDGELRYSWENKNPWVRSGDGRYRGGIASLHEDGSGSAMVLFTAPLSEFGDRTLALILLDSADVVGDIKQLTDFVAKNYVYGIEKNEEFIREHNEPTPSLLHKMKTLLDLEQFLQDTITYERDLS